MIHICIETINGIIGKNFQVLSFFNLNFEKPNVYTLQINLFLVINVIFGVLVFSNYYSRH